MLVLGLGRSGLAAAAALERRGVEVVRADRELGNDEDIGLLGGLDLLVKSPGVPAEAPLVVAASMVDLGAERDALLRLCQRGLGWACLRPDANGTAPWLAAVSLLGFGILLLAIRRPVRSEERIDCPFCAEPIRVEAVLCPHCRSEFDRGRDRVSRGR